MKRYAYLPVLALVAFAVALLPAAASARHGHHHRHHSSRKNSSGWHNDSSGPIGHVTSFDGTTLMITLNNGDQMSGTVDRQTEVECRNNEAGDNEGNEPGDNNNEMNGVRAADHGDSSGGNDGNEQEDKGRQNCSSALTSGTAVDRAVLDGTSNGAVFDRVDVEG